LYDDDGNIIKTAPKGKIAAKGKAKVQEKDYDFF
jgi:hypothetical protein